MPKTAVMTKVKDCVHSTPFKTTNEDAPISNVYIRKNHKLARESQVEQVWDENGVTIRGI